MYLRALLRVIEILLFGDGTVYTQWYKLTVQIRSVLASFNPNVSWSTPTEINLAAMPQKPNLVLLSVNPISGEEPSPHFTTYPPEWQIYLDSRMA